MLSRISRTHSDLQVQSKRDAVDLLYSNALNGLLVTIISLSALVFGFNNTFGHDLKVSIWLVMVGVLVLRLGDTFYWRIRLKDVEYNPNQAYLRFIIGTVLTTIIWGIYTTQLYDDMSVMELATTMVVVSAMAGGAATVLAPSRLVSVYYCSAMILPLSLLAILDERPDFEVIGYLGLLFWVAMLMASIKAYEFVASAIAIKHKNDQLVALMREERNETTRVNAELRESNLKLDQANATLEEEVTRRTDAIHRLSNRDPLTSLMNRAGFTRHLNNMLKMSAQGHHSLAVLFIDLDGFKQVNDGLGHQVGDIVLAEIANRLTRFCESDHLARWGGDEFVIVLPYANRDTAIAVAQAARSSITNPIVAMENQISLDATIGIALYPDHGSKALDLVQQADLTMYEQKRAQRGTVGVYSQEIFEKLKQEQELREGLKNAIENKEFYLVYQPIVNAKDGSLWAVEALIRWQFQGQLVGPDTFIPLAEKAGLINEIGTWVLHRACIDAAQWPLDDVGVSVNVSVPQLMDEGFIKVIDNVLTTSGLSPERLHLEITESIFADDKAQLNKQINALKERHIKIAIDDFGTGFSSLSQLQLLSFDHIKIDRVFVQNLEEGSDTIIRATLLMAQEFGCQTVAEGIETQAHADRLSSMGVTCLQGYFYSKPLEIEGLVNWYYTQKSE